MASILQVDRVRFYGDRQRSHGKNAHRRVLAFASCSDLAVLDLGSGHRRLLPHHVTADLVDDDAVDIQLDAHRLPFPDGVWDRIIVQNLLEHVAFPTAVVSELARVLRPGGEAYIEVPFLYPMHDRTDFRRWTILGLSSDVAPLAAIESGVTIGPWSTLGLITRATLTNRIRNPYFAAAVDLFSGLVLLPLTAIDRAIGSSAESQILAGAVYVIGRRSSPGGVEEA